MFDVYKIIREVTFGLNSELKFIFIVQKYLITFGPLIC